MKRESYKQFAIVRSDSASLFETQLNAKMEELRENRPEVTFSETGEYLIARISYVMNVTTPESDADLFSMKGVSFTCQDCPMFSPILKADGTEDARVKYGDCPFCTYGRTNKTAAACQRLFDMMREGRIKLCLSESDS